MTTKLEAPVKRLIPDFTIDKREVVAGLQIIGGKPMLTFKQKGMKQGWMFDLCSIAEYCAKAPRKPAQEYTLAHKDV